jgi:hypothetical protein
LNPTTTTSTNTPPTSSRQGAPECLLRHKQSNPELTISILTWHSGAVLVWRLWWRLHREVALFFMVHDSLHSNGCFGLLSFTPTTWLVGCPLIGRLFVCWSVVRWSVVGWSAVRLSVIACWSFASLLYHNDTRHFPHPIYIQRAQYLPIYSLVTAVRGDDHHRQCCQQCCQ